MNKLVKPFVLFFAVAISSGAFAQQGEPGRQIKKQVGARDVKAHSLVDPKVDQHPGRVGKANVKKVKHDAIRKKGVKSVRVAR